MADPDRAAIRSIEPRLMEGSRTLRSPASQRVWKPGYFTSVAMLLAGHRLLAWQASQR